MAIITIRGITITSTDGPSPPLLTLLTWFSPAFPIGAFAFSHGLEAAVAEGQVADAGEVAEWIETLLLSGSGWNDLVLLREGLRLAGNAPALDDLAELASALSGSAERRQETEALGISFGRAVAPWARVEADQPYPVAVAAAAASSGFPARHVLAAYAHAFAANLVSAAVRLVPLGQSEAVTVLQRLEATIADAAGRAETSTLKDLGSCSLLSDIAAMRHETLRTRLFRS